jgi:hypothetical protein
VPFTEPNEQKDLQGDSKSLRCLQGYNPFNFGSKGITNQSTKINENTDSDNVIKGTFKVVLNIYTLAQG